MDFYDTENVITWLTPLAVATVGLLAIWVTLGRGRRSARVVVVALLLSLLLFVPAYDLLVTFMVQVVVAVAVLTFWQRLGAKRSGQPFWQFGLGDLLLLTFVEAALIGVAASVPAEAGCSWRILECFYVEAGPEILPWQYWIVVGSTCGILTALSAWVVFGRCRLRIRLAVTFVAFPLLVMLMYWGFYFDLFWGQPDQRLGGWKNWPIVFDESVLLYSMIAFPVMVVWLTLFRVSFREHDETTESDSASPGHKRRSLPRLTARLGLVGLSLLVLFPLAWMCWFVMPPPAVPHTALPDPNAYDRLVELGKRLEDIEVPVDEPTYSYSPPRLFGLGPELPVWGMLGLDPPDQSLLPQPEWPHPRKFINFAMQHRTVLDEIDACIDMPISVPVDYDDISTWAFEEEEPLEHVVHAMLAAGRAAALEGDYQQAANRFADTIRLSRQIGRDGILMHWLCGLRFEEKTLKAIRKERADMPPMQRRALADVIARGPQPLGPVLQRCDLWYQRAFRWQGRLTHYLDKLSGSPIFGHDNYRDWERTGCAFRRILIAELALENHRDKHGEYPTRLDELVPDELKELPLDPFTDKPLRYRRTSEGFMLYSVGRNGQDDKGVVKHSPYDKSTSDDVRFESVGEESGMSGE